MSAARVALVCSEPSLRLELARAFDDAPAEWTVELCERAPEGADVVIGTGRGRGIDVVFDPSRPADVLAAVAEALRCQGRAIVVTSACGGAGVTTVAVHLASALSSTSAPCCYVDVDPNLGGASRLGMPEEILTFDPADRFMTVPHGGGFRAVFAPDHPKAAIAHAIETFTTTVVDAPLSASDDVLSHPDARVVVVVPPTVPGVARTRAFLERHDARDWVIAGNRIGPGGETTRTELARTLGRRFDVMLPCSALLRDREDAGAILTTPLSRWRRVLDRLANGLRVG